jgi:ketosteroid isomerase-like protein
VSQENVAIVRQIYERWDRGATASDLIAPDVEYINPDYAVEPGTRRGRDSFDEVGSSLADFKLEIERVVDAGPDEVVVCARYSAYGRGSGVPLGGEHGYVWTIRDGVAVRFRWFQSHDEALAAAGVGT